MRGTGVVALLAIYPTLRWPDVAGLVGFLCITMFLHGPLAPLLPAAHEAVLLVTGRAYPPLLVAGVGIAGTLYAGALRRHDHFVGIDTVALFERAPFFCVWMCSWSPLPYWAVRFLAPLSGYDVRRYLLATFLGRGPRYYFIALFGKLLPVSNLALAVITVALIGVAVLIGMVQRGRRRRAATIGEVAPA